MWFIYWDPCGLACYVFGWFVVLLANYVTLFEVRVPCYAEPNQRRVDANQPPA